MAVLGEPFWFSFFLSVLYLFKMKTPDLYLPLWDNPDEWLLFQSGDAMHFLLFHLALYSRSTQPVVLH